MRIGWVSPTQNNSQSQGDVFVPLGLAGQLIREDNSLWNNTFVYTYDNGGNLLTKQIYALTAEGVTPTNPINTYTYGYGAYNWGDLLLSYRGVSFQYDRIGNPTSYYNGNEYTFTWEQGRRLATAVVGTTELEFTYNDEGIRTSKTVNGSKHTYYLNGSQIIAEEFGSTLLVYLYDAEGSPIGMQYRTSSFAEGVFETYWFEKNLQGDIVAVYDERGVKQISYTYDAWGNFQIEFYDECTYSDNVVLNPFLYRGYYYDAELGMYYLQSRYYDPVIGRYINADGYISTGQGLLGYNMYAYCGNNPVNRVDPEGKSWIAVAIVVVLCALFLTGCQDSQYGAAAPFTESNSTTQNCLAYALGEDEWMYVGGSPGAVGNYDVDHVAGMLMDDMTESGRSIRPIDSYDSPIEKDEYRIALRTSYDDYHFMVQHSDGTWSHKPGFLKSRRIEGNNPSEVSWDLPQINEVAYYLWGVIIENGCISNYYDSEIRYFAVSRK